jgi:phosphoribosylformylglycinamidine synthase
VLGVCNGFQVLTEAGMLPGVLLSNKTLKFHCKDVHLRVETSQTLFTSGYEQGQVIRVPVAHHDGNYFADAATLDRLEDKGLVAFRYCSPAGELTEADNHNGSARNIAGIFNETKTVLGLMPHPEDATDELLGNIDGRGLFDGMTRALMGASAA